MEKGGVLGQKWANTGADEWKRALNHGAALGILVSPKFLESSMTTRQPKGVEVLVAGEALDATAVRHAPEKFQSALLIARATYGSAICCCSQPRLPLVIRERSGRLFLAAWPDQAALHALACPFYSESRNGEHPASGIVLEGGDRNTLSLHRALRKRAADSAGFPARTGSGTLSVRQDDKQTAFHLWGALHYLWEESGLNRWSPGWHRDWGFVRHALRRVAQRTFVGEEALISSLYIPPVWSPKRRDETVEHWKRFTAPLRKNHRGAEVVECGMVIGSVRALEPSPHGFALKLHHHAESFYMDQRMADILAQYSRRGWSAIKHLDPAVDGDEKAYVIAALRVESSRTGRMVIAEGVLMRVSPRFIPVNSSYEDRVARLLVNQDRQFVRPLHYDRHSAHLPNFVLRDVGRSNADAVAMYVYGPSIGAHKRGVQEEADRAASKAQGMGYWRWDAGSQAQPPPLPDAFATSHSSNQAT